MIERDNSDYTREASKVMRELGGYFAIEGARVDLGSLALMARIKSALDPDGIFVI